MAMGTMAMAMTLTAFFVGLQFGRKLGPPAPVAEAVQPLVGEEAKKGDLEVLLAQVEKARAPITFPDRLSEPTEALPPPPDPNAPPVTPDAAAAAAMADAEKTAAIATAVLPKENAPVGQAVIAPVAPAAVAQDPRAPSKGWALRVAKVADEASAEALITSLEARGLKGYRKELLVDGKRQIEVRVGGFSSKEEAEGARGKAGDLLKEKSSPPVTAP